MLSVSTEAGLVGSRPATYLNRLFCPVPSASEVAQDSPLVIEPLTLFVGWLGKYWARHQSGIPSPPLSRYTVRAAMAVLLARVGSNVAELTVAVLVMLVMLLAAVAVPTIVTVAAALVAR